MEISCPDGTGLYQQLLPRLLEVPRTRGGGSAFSRLSGAPAGQRRSRWGRGAALATRGRQGSPGSGTARGRAPAFSQQLHGGLGAPPRGSSTGASGAPAGAAPHSPGAAQRGLATGALLGAAGSRKQTEGTFSSFSRSPALLFMVPP